MSASLGAAVVAPETVACTKNSTFPAVPRSGDAMTPMMPVPAAFSAEDTSVRVWRQIAGSRVTPLSPDTSGRPPPELGLHQHDHVAARTHEPDQSWSDRAQRNEGQVCGREVDEAGRSEQTDVGESDVQALVNVHPGIPSEAVVQLTPPDV